MFEKINFIPEIDPRKEVHNLYTYLFTYVGGLFINYVTQAHTCRIQCCIFQPAFGCCARQTLVEIAIISVFAAKNLKKSKKFAANFCKKKKFFNLHQNAGRLFYFQKKLFFFFFCSIMIYLVISI